MRCARHRRCIRCPRSSSLGHRRSMFRPMSRPSCKTTTSAIRRRPLASRLVLGRFPLRKSCREGSAGGEDVLGESARRGGRHCPCVCRIPVVTRISNHDDARRAISAQLVPDDRVTTSSAAAAARVRRCVLSGGIRGVSAVVVVYVGAASGRRRWATRTATTTGCIGRAVVCRAGSTGSGASLSVGAAAARTAAAAASKIWRGRSGQTTSVSLPGRCRSAAVPRRRPARTAAASAVATACVGPASGATATAAAATDGSRNPKSGDRTVRPLTAPCVPARASPASADGDRVNRSWAKRRAGSKHIATSAAAAAGAKVGERTTAAAAASNDEDLC